MHRWNATERARTTGAAATSSLLMALLVAGCGGSDTEYAVESPKLGAATESPFEIAENGAIEGSEGADGVTGNTKVGAGEEGLVYCD